MSVRPDYSGDFLAYRRNFQKMQDTYEYHYERIPMYMEFLASVENWQWAAFFGTIFVVCFSYYKWTYYIPWTQPKITKKVFMEVSHKYDGKVFPLGRIEFGLYGDAMPKTVENFRQLCTGEARSQKKGEPLSYMGTWLHTVRTGFVIQGGDTQNEDGSAGEGIYGLTFEDENHDIHHGKKGLLSTAKLGHWQQGRLDGDGKSMGSQFKIHMVESLWNDGYDTVFGEVLSGYDDCVMKINELGSDHGRTYASGTEPTHVPHHKYFENGAVETRIFVSACGEIPFTPANTMSGLPLDEENKMMAERDTRIWYKREWYQANGWYDNKKNQ